MASIRKILIVDRVEEKLSEELYGKLENEYLLYSKQVYDMVNEMNGIPNKDAKDAIFKGLLSPFQYFLEDWIRIKRLNEGKFVNPYAIVAKKY